MKEVKKRDKSTLKSCYLSNSKSKGREEDQNFKNFVDQTVPVFGLKLQHMETTTIANGSLLDLGKLLVKTKE